MCRQIGITDTTFYTWRSTFAGLEVSEDRRLRQVEEENRPLKGLMADNGSTCPAAASMLHAVGLRPARGTCSS
ncbi:MAG: hypothetical protein C0405_03895 [Desulfovibrio sp.]|nr:hypothetical protein [Desulfovibrio sp.]